MTSTNLSILLITKIVNCEDNKAKQEEKLAKIEGQVTLIGNKVDPQVSALGHLDNYNEILSVIYKELDNNNDGNLNADDYTVI